MARPRVLVLSELYPNPVKPAFGIFVERQTHHLGAFCDVHVVAPVRVFPPLRLWKEVANPARFGGAWNEWLGGIRGIPPRDVVNGIPVEYPRYISPPRQFFHGSWGFFAYPFLRDHIRGLHLDRPFDLIHAHYACPSGVIGLMAQRWMHVPIVLSIHGADVTYTARQIPIGRMVVRWVFRNVDTILVNSSKTGRLVNELGGKPGIVRLVRLGGNEELSPNVEANTNSVRTDSRRLSSQNETITLLSVGYLEEEKGHAYVLMALRCLLDEGYSIRYVIVGNGSREHHLKSLADNLGLAGAVSFEGYKAHSDVWTYFRNCDIFVLPSWNEAFGVVYIEALGLGKPVIGCAGEGGPDDLKALGDCIELVEPRDVASLTHGLKRLIDDPERRRRMGKEGQRIVSRYYTWSRNAEETLAIYKELLEK